VRVGHQNPAGSSLAAKSSSIGQVSANCAIFAVDGNLKTLLRTDRVSFVDERGREGEGGATVLLVSLRRVLLLGCAREIILRLGGRMSCVRVLSVQRIVPRGRPESVALFIGAAGPGDEVCGKWVSAQQVLELKEAMKKAGASGEVPDADSKLLVDAAARSEMEKALGVLAEFAKENEAGAKALKHFLGAEVFEACLLAIKSAKTGYVCRLSKAKEFVLSRVRGRVLLAFKLILQELRKKLAAVTAVAVIGTVFASATGRERLRAYLFGAISGVVTCGLLYESSFHHGFEEGIARAEIASKSSKKPFVVENYDAADEADLKILSKEIQNDLEESGAGKEVSPEELEAMAEADIELVAKLDELEEKSKYKEAWSACQNFLERPVRTRRYEVTWRVARAGYMYADELKKKKGLTDPIRLEILQKALEIIEYCLENFPNECGTHKYYAIIAQENTNHQGNKEKITGGFIFEEHTRKAIELNDQDPTLHYMLGLFCFEVAKLSWTERMGAKAIFGREPPKTTIEEAIKCFKKAHNLRNPSLPALLEILRCYIKLNDKDQAQKTMRELQQHAKEAEQGPELSEILQKAKQIEKQIY